MIDTIKNEIVESNKLSEQEQADEQAKLVLIRSLPFVRQAWTNLIKNARATMNKTELKNFFSDFNYNDFCDELRLSLPN